MTNGDTAAEILEYVENEGADMPKQVTNKMLAIVLREQHHITRENFERIEAMFEKLAKGVEGNSAKIAALEQAQALCKVRTEIEQEAQNKRDAQADKRFDRKMQSLEAYGVKELLTGALGGLAVFIVSRLPDIWEWLVALFN